MQKPTISRDGPLPSSKICNVLLVLLVTAKSSYLQRYFWQIVTCYSNVLLPSTACNKDELRKSLLVQILQFNILDHDTTYNKFVLRPLLQDNT